MYIYNNGILFSLLKEETPAICDNMCDSGGHYTKRNKPDKKDKCCMVSLICGMLKKKKTVQLLEIESRMVVARG